MKRDYNNPYVNFEHLDKQATTWVQDYADLLDNARNRLVLSLLLLSTTLIGVQCVNKTLLKHSPARPPIQALVFAGGAAAFATMTNLLRIRKEADNGWSNMQRIQIESREDMTQQLAERNYMPYAATDEDSQVYGGLSDE